ncbi:CPBP family intramembrane metalloprotease [Agromyces sp. ISL-38]|uniref:CPBP family intramembrane glutamic endopeptidase n=1 Tax=Agromyces sp. ISL-38 TaxID=2819107 RepID=UPI001BEC42B0|nr:type II CAAX endopeptidase family protein [Agromyces sp. ISL-38]MBT2498999.1 CPBP family intramembrane metalloprotease [Agromyces sp. ISL-38]MBT2518456.1 CPBP family intramembrane metalloprotease [Streptomyces sp. ISL-90]
MTKDAPEADDLSTSQGVPAPSAPIWGVADAAFGTIFAILCVLGWTALVRTVIIDPAVQVLGAYLAVWIPLLGGVLVASFVRGRRSLTLDFGLRFTWLDLCWGVGLGLLARAAVSGIELATSGRVAGFGVRLELPTGFELWFGVLLAPIVLGPLVEELFFRGLVLRAVERGAGVGGHGSGDDRTDRRTRVAAASVAVLTSALVFALLHVTQAATVSEAWRSGAGSLVFGLAAGVATVLTGRLGAAIIGHMVFNGVLIAAVLSA